MDGVVNVYKEAGMTSFDVVFHCRCIFSTRKVGHTGTLDPMAVGVLPVCIGKGTKLVEYLTADEKEYIATLRLGLETDTQDSTGKVLHSSDAPVSQVQVQEALQQFVGDIQQVPPMYSALKVDGKKLVDLARRGVEVERQPRPVVIHEIEILEAREQQREYVIRVHCGKGTYIRTLCHDVGQVLGVGGVMASLERTRSGVFDRSTAVTLDTLRDAVQQGNLEQYLLSLDFPFQHDERLTVDGVQERLVRNGVALMLSRTRVKPGSGRVAVYSKAGQLLIVGQKDWKKDSLRLEKSFF